jgi:hypothetical protein
MEAKLESSGSAGTVHEVSRVCSVTRCDHVKNRMLTNGTINLKCLHRADVCVCIYVMQI